MRFAPATRAYSPSSGDFTRFVIIQAGYRIAVQKLNHPMHRSLLTILCVLATSACHTFRPVVVDELIPGQTVRARITGAFSDSLSPILMRDAREFEGIVVENSGSSILMEIPVDRRLAGLRFETLSQRVEIPAAEFLDLDIKELDRGRTFLAVGVAVAAVGGFLLAQLNKRSGGGSNGGPGGPQDAILPVPVISAPIVGFSWSRR